MPAYVESRDLVTESAAKSAAIPPDSDLLRAMAKRPATNARTAYSTLLSQGVCSNSSTLLKAKSLARISPLHKQGCHNIYGAGRSSLKERSLAQLIAWQTSTNLQEESAEEF